MDAWTGDDDQALAAYLIARPQPLPFPLDAVIAWIEAEEMTGTLVSFYLPETLAAGIDHPDPCRLGEQLRRVTARYVQHACTAGFSVAALREAATRIRFAL